MQLPWGCTTLPLLLQTHTGRWGSSEGWGCRLSPFIAVGVSLCAITCWLVDPCGVKCWLVDLCRITCWLVGLLDWTGVYANDFGPFSWGSLIYQFYLASAYIFIITYLSCYIRCVVLKLQKTKLMLKYHFSCGVVIVGSICLTHFSKWTVMNSMWLEVVSAGY